MESARNYSKTSMDAYSRSLGTMQIDPMISDTLKSLQKEERTLNGRDKESNANRSFKDAMNDYFKEESDDIQKRFDSMRARNLKRLSNNTEENPIKTIKMSCLNYILLLLFGEKLKTQVPDGYGSPADLSGSGFLRPADTVNLNAVNQGSPTGLYQITSAAHYLEEKEYTTFATTGTVVTADGRSLDFHLEAQMSREFMEYSEVSVYDRVQLCDPLVINLNSNPASVSDQKFLFDIDSDGVKDSVSMLSNGSGFLALDRNGDGVINDGSELFGTKSGNGFADLAKYDEDGNGWIDENDSIFEKLKIWTFDEDGNQKLMDLKEAGVGAMYLGSASTDFTVQSANTFEVNARIRRTGLFLYENGMAGTMQQVDMATSAP